MYKKKKNQNVSTMTVIKFFYFRINRYVHYPLVLRTVRSGPVPQY